MAAYAHNTFTSKQMLRVLIVAYGGAHVAMAMPLRLALIESGYEPVILALTTTTQVYRSQNIPVTRFIDHVDIKDSRIDQWGKYLSKNHHKEGIGISHGESIAYLGASLVDLIDEVGEAEALARYAALGLNALTPVNTLKHIIKRERIGAVIATDSPRAERAALLAAASLGLPNLCAASSFVSIGVSFLSRADQGQRICVFNQRIATQLLAAGRPPHSIRITGNPAFDNLNRPDDETLRSQLRSQRGLSGTRHVVLWAEQPEPSNPDLPVAVRNQLAALCYQHGWQLLIRLHPSSQAHGSNEALPSTAMVSPREESIRHALLICDTVVTLTSTVGLEALIMGKNLLIVNISEYSQFVDYRAEDGACVIGSQGDIEMALLDIFNRAPRILELQEKRRQTPYSGGAARTIVENLKELIVESTP